MISWIVGDFLNIFREVKSLSSYRDSVVPVVQLVEGWFLEMEFVEATQDLRNF